MFDRRFRTEIRPFAAAALLLFGVLSIYYLSQLSDVQWPE